MRAQSNHRNPKKAKLAISPYYFRFKLFENKSILVLLTVNFDHSPVPKPPKPDHPTAVSICWSSPGRHVEAPCEIAAWRQYWNS